MGSQISNIFDVYDLRLVGSTIIIFDTTHLVATYMSKMDWISPHFVGQNLLYLSADSDDDGEAG